MSWQHGLSRHAGVSGIYHTLQPIMMRCATTIVRVSKQWVVYTIVIFCVTLSAFWYIQILYPTHVMGAFAVTVCMMRDIGHIREVRFTRIIITGSLHMYVTLPGRVHAIHTCAIVTHRPLPDIHSVWLRPMHTLTAYLKGGTSMHVCIHVVCKICKNQVRMCLCVPLCIP